MSIVGHDYRSLLTSATCLFLLLTKLSASDDVVRVFDADVKPFLSTYCLKCHGEEKIKGDLDLTKIMQPRRALEFEAIWKDSYGRVHSQDMPPDNGKTKIPTIEERHKFLSWVKSLKYLHPKDPGRGTIRRMSQVEYANTIYDLLGVDRAVAATIPQDTVGAGFNSSIPPLLMEKYLNVASDSLDAAIVPDRLDVSLAASSCEVIIDGKLQPKSAAAEPRTYKGTWEILTPFIAPVDGTYTIRFRAGCEKMATRDTPIIAVRNAGQVLKEFKITSNDSAPRSYSFTTKLSAGEVNLSFLNTTPMATVQETNKEGKAITKEVERSMLVESIDIRGPAASRPTPIQEKIFIATPSETVSKTDAARTIITVFARSAYRRPPTENEITQLMAVFRLADDRGAVFSDSVKLMLKAVLISPGFLYLTPDNGKISGKNGDIVKLGHHQIAAKLSYLFWSTMPDAELSALADAEKLHDPEILRQQVKRLLRDSRSIALWNGFGAQWLHLDRLKDLEVDTDKYPLMTPDMRKAMYDEVGMLFSTILRENRSMVEFVDNDYTYLNEINAKLYNMGGSIDGLNMREVKLVDQNRGGILTLPGVLAVTSLPTRTSPVKRGAFVLEQILGQEQPTPPMNVPPLEQKDDLSTAGLNLRQRMERHRADPACIGCHQVIDPIGFGLENFDAMGRWRDDDDTGAAVDATGVLPGNIKFRTPYDLKKIIADRKDEFVHGLVRRALAYSLCRSLHGYDEVVAEEITAAVIKDGYRFQTLWCEIATSYPFLHRRITR